MAAVSVNVASVKYGVIARSSDLKHNLTAGASTTIELGDNVYLDSATSTYKLASTLTALTSDVVGVAITRCAASGTFSLMTKGELYGLTLTGGDSIELSDTAGEFETAGSAASGEFPCGLGIAKSTTVLAYQPITSGVAHA